MDYKKIYNTIVETAKHRINDGYVEKHHIIPRCMGGTDDSTNIVALTAREHFVCHQLLVKIYPEHSGLVNAATMMCCASGTHGGGRVNNRLYEWLRIRHALEMSESQLGSKNSQFGSFWVFNPTTNETLKLANGSIIPSGYHKGRSGKFCDNCADVVKSHVKFCPDCRKLMAHTKRKSNTNETYKKLYDVYIAGNYKSLREFARSDDCNVSHVMLANKFKHLLKKP